MILAASLEQAWLALSTLPPARGELAGHKGTAVLEEADDDTHTATLRLQGRGPSGPMTATVTVTLTDAWDGTHLALAADAHPGPLPAAYLAAYSALLAAALSPAAATWAAR